MNKPRISVVVPSLNEADNLAVVVPTIPAEYELIIVEGSRFHRTSQLVSSTRPDTLMVEQTRYGKGNALACGFAAATGEIIVMFDADGSADAAEIPRFVDAITAGADLVKGSRSRRSGGSSDDITRLRSLGNFGLTMLTNIMFRTRYRDLCYGFVAFRRDILPLLDLPDPGAPGSPAQWGDGFEIETVILARAAKAALRVDEIPSHERQRIHGVSNLNAWSDGRRVLSTLIREARRAPAPVPTPRVGAMHES